MKFISLFLILMVFTRLVSASDWPTCRSPRRDGVLPETNWSRDWPPVDPETVWKVNVGTRLTSVVVAKGHLFTTGWARDQDLVLSLDTITGATNWCHTYAQPLGGKCGTSPVLALHHTTFQSPIFQIYP